VANLRCAVWYSEIAVFLSSLWRVQRNLGREDKLLDVYGVHRQDLGTPTMYVSTKSCDVCGYLFRYCCGLDHIEFAFYVHLPWHTAIVASSLAWPGPVCWIRRGSRWIESDPDRIHGCILLSDDSTVLLIANVPLLFLPKPWTLSTWYREERIKSGGKVPR
jgi:hypothetical protein